MAARTGAASRARERRRQEIRLQPVFMSAPFPFGAVLVLEEVAEAIQADQEDLQIYTSGATNIFKYPELSDGEKASKLLSTFEKKDELQDLIAEINQNENSSETGIQVYIGDEMPVQSMKDCSVVTANYELGEGLLGTIGIIGPKRMDYEKVLGTLKNLMTQLDMTFKKEKGD